MFDFSKDLIDAVSKTVWIILFINIFFSGNSGLLFRLIFSSAKLHYSDPILKQDDEISLNLELLKVKKGIKTSSIKDAQLLLSFIEQNKISPARKWFRWFPCLGIRQITKNKLILQFYFLVYF